MFRAYNNVTVLLLCTRAMLQKALPLLYKKVSRYHWYHEL